MKRIVTCPCCGLEVAVRDSLSAECPRCGSMVSACEPRVHDSAVVPVMLCPLGGVPGIRERVELDYGTHTIGRRSDRSDATVQLDVHDFFMSKRHAMVIVERDFSKGTVVTVCDAGSSNGTFINDRRLGSGESVRVADGDMMRLGNTLFRFSISHV
ncbi:MAG: FHA domain-containing protein [Paramuribaculum sp.]|nr:FHA domain-containing protein [Paramuribaculum sp.]